MIAVGVTALIAALPGRSSACTPPPHPRPDHLVAQSAVRDAAVILDAEVIEVSGSDWEGWVVIKPLKVWKGTEQAQYKLTFRSFCDVGVEAFRPGARYRLLLQQDEDGLHVDQGDNGLLGRDLGAFVREVDRLLDARRPPDFEPCPCKLVPPLRSGGGVSRSNATTDGGGK